VVVLEQRGNLWWLAEPGDALVITTNGFVARDGHAVMGRGIAYEATQRDPTVSFVLGEKIRTGGNHVHIIHPQRQSSDFDWVSMPVKHHWRDMADPNLIVRSALELAALAPRWNRIWMPRPGCGNGHLDWADVKPLIEPILDDRFIAVTYGPSPGSPPRRW
jgi:hypothetical protein